MHKKISPISDTAMENINFISALKKSERSGKGSLRKVKAHLNKVAKGK